MKAQEFNNNHVLDHIIRDTYVEFCDFRDQVVMIETSGIAHCIFVNCVVSLKVKDYIYKSVFINCHFVKVDTDIDEVCESGDCYFFKCSMKKWDIRANRLESAMNVLIDCDEPTVEVFCNC